MRVTKAKNELALDGKFKFSNYLSTLCLQRPHKKDECPIWIDRLKFYIIASCGNLAVARLLGLPASQAGSLSGIFGGSEHFEILVGVRNLNQEGQWVCFSKKL